MKKSKKYNSSRVPIYRDAGFELYDAKLTARAFEDEKLCPADPDLYIYSRYRNPTVVAAEEKICSLEKSEWALLTQSGMSAIDVALSIFQHKGNVRPWLFFTEIYGGTNSFIDSVLINRRGLDIHFFEPEGAKYSLENLETKIKELKPEILFLEIVSNPMLIVADIREISKLAKSYDVKVIVDNTFATPLLINPLDIGADLVIHSATKYLGGHGNITAGVVCGNNQDLRREAVDYRKFAGHMLAADEAYRLSTQMESFSIRVKQQFINSMAIAEFLQSSDLVENVLYPGLVSHPTHKLAKDLFKDTGYGAIVTFSINGNDEEQKRINRDKFIELVYPEIKLIPTLGDSHTILMPVEPVWGYKYPEPGMIRLSVGFEETEVLLNILSSALNKL